MQLSARLVSYYLSKAFRIRCSIYLSEEPILKYALRNAHPESFEQEIIYIVDDPEILIPARSLTKSMLIMTGDPYQNYELLFPNLCILQETVSATQLLSFVQELFYTFDNWNQALMESRLSNAPLQHLLEITEPLIPNPMMLMSMDFTIHASTNTSYGELKNSMLGTTDNTIGLVNSLKHDKVFEESCNKDGVFYYPGNGIASPQLCINIKQFSETVYRLMIGKGEVPQDETFGFVLERLAQYITHAVSSNVQRRQASPRSLHQIFTTLLTDPSADYVEISRQLTVSGWLSSHLYRCVLIQTSDLDSRFITLHSICNYIENTIPASCALEFKGKVVIYINLSLCSISENSMMQKIAGFVRDSMLNAAYSRSLLGHFNFYRQYIQALNTITIGQHMYPSRWIHHFNDIALNYILQQAAKKLPAYMLCHEKLLQLKNISDSGTLPLYETLRAYLNNHQNVTKTAEDLFIHRSTLLYRLDKIRDILKSDLSNPSEILYLLLSFQLMDMNEETPAAAENGQFQISEEIPNSLSMPSSSSF